MHLNLTKENVFNLKFLSAFFLLTWICFEAHEFSHYSAVLFQGGRLYAAFNQWWVVGGSGIAGDAAGPLMTYILMWTGMFMLAKSKNHRLLGFALIFANTPLSRIAGPGHIPSGDERNIAAELGISPSLFLIPVLLAVMPPLIIAYKSIGNRHRLLWFLFFFLAAPVSFAIAVLAVDQFFLLPIVKKSYETGIPLIPMVFGIPVVIIVTDIVVLALFLGKFVRYLSFPVDGRAVPGNPV